MTIQNTYIPGDHYVICDLCGFKRRISECRKNHYNQIVCADTCWEPQHPQERRRLRPERIAVRNARPEPEDVFIDQRAVTPDDL